GTRYGASACGARKQILVIVSEYDNEAKEALESLSDLSEFEICPIWVPLSWQADTARPSSVATAAAKLSASVGPDTEHRYNGDARV
ncbi:MAG: hypothetical protein AAGG44_15230, partial [Planctomycetota bacterium]